jgi:pilus assembly protein Flp/PilA
MRSVRKFLACESGLTVIEYGLVAGLVTVCLVAAAGMIASSLNSVFEHLSHTIGAAAPRAGGITVRCDGGCQ